MIARVAAALVVFAAAVVAIERWSVEPLLCARAASRARIALEDGADVRPILVALANCETTTHSRARVLATRADAFRAAGNPQRAIFDYALSLESDRRPEVYLALGFAQLEAYDREGALQTLERACAYDPARLARIPYDDVRAEVARRVTAHYGAAWLR
jgi:tetratricopeptide (TPR) repeat protein